MFCVSCGSQLKDSNKFCPQCGASVVIPQLDFSLAEEYCTVDNTIPQSAILKSHTNMVQKDNIEKTKINVERSVHNTPDSANKVTSTLDWQKLFDLKNIWSVVLIAALILSMLIFPIIRLETYSYTRYVGYYNEEHEESYIIDMLGEKTDFEKDDDEEELRDLDDIINTASRILFIITTGAIIGYIICLIKNDSRAKAIVSVVLLASWVIYIVAIFGLTGSEIIFSIFDQHYYDGYSSGRIATISPSTGLFFSMICVIGIVVATNIEIIRSKTLSTSHAL